jgi:hypothetical protein
MELEFTCLKDKKKTKEPVEKLIKYDNGRYRVSATHKLCGTKLSKFVSAELAKKLLSVGIKMEEQVSKPKKPKKSKK